MAEAEDRYPSCPWPRLSRRTWLLVQAEYRRDLLAELEIAYAGFMVFRPCYKLKVRDRTRHRRWSEVERSVFPGYLFAKPEDDAVRSAASCIEGLRGVREIVRVTGKPGMVPDVFVNEMLAMAGTDYGELRRRRRLAATFKPGDRVRVKDGQFSDFWAEVDEVDPDGRITLLIDLLGRLVPVAGIDAEHLEALPPPRDGGACPPHKTKRL